MKIVFVSGAGRSGSTLLDRLLGRAKGVRSVGELRHAWRLGFIENEYCGCGERFRACPFWREVVERAFGGFDGVDAEELDREQELLIRMRHLPFLVLPRLATASLRRQQEAWAGTQSRLLDAIREVAGATAIVDSTKNPMYGLLLYRLPGVDLRTVHLIRDSRAVAFSWAHRLKEHPMEAGRFQFALAKNWHAGTWWLLANLLTQFAPPLRRRYLRVRYEDLARAPEGWVERICAFADLPMVHADEDGATYDLGVHHSIGGNPMRFQKGAVAVRADTEWRTAMEPRDRRVITAMTWPLLAWYGYLRAPKKRRNG